MISYGKKNILIIGGSRFVGSYLIKLLQNRGHSLTVFNRGKIQSKYDGKIKFIRGDRNRGFADLKDRYDAVVDMCSYSASQTERAINELNFDFFIHMSTAAVYKKTEKFPLTEESPLGEWPLWGNYNKNKIECEETLKKSGVKYATIRPVYILGPKNYCDREHFIYSRIHNKQHLTLPGNGEANIQFVFTEEVAELISLIIEKNAAGKFNCAGNEATTLVDLVNTMGKIADRKPILRFNPLNNGENFDIGEFPFANENVIVSNNKAKELGVTFNPLLNGLKKDYENYYKNVV